ncbi:HAD-IA family hydrolase [Streptomyces sp. NPDC050617]|uniref:HAD family hydrolase n=1 Tax=Streptomyces sp. NPDC050617 TaxID=3154628 RepID=UPI003448F20B
MTTPLIPGRPFDAVLCDLDNVIRYYDTSRLAERERAAGLAEGTTAKVAFEPATDLPVLLGEIGEEEWIDSIALGLSGQVSPELARELGTILLNSPFSADEAVVDLLRRVRTHVPLVLVTNATKRLEGDLVTMGLDGLAHHVVSSARVGLVKPDREIYEFAAARAGVAVERCLFVDDRLENVEAAIALGMTGVHYRELADLRAAVDGLLGN